jgi:DNA-binding GntR family transcriptional regulator
MSNLQPIKLLPARERVASVLRKAILTRELREGTEITLEGIASQLGVSNTPVREAFQMLNRDGLIKQRPNKGAIVLGIDTQFIRDHYETRAILEEAAAGAVCRNGADISEIRNAHESARNAFAIGDLSNYSNFNLAFHMAIWEAAGNKKMASILSEMWNGLSIGHNITEVEYANISMPEHVVIFDTIVARDEIAARERMYSHIIRSMEDVMTHFNLE